LLQIAASASGTPVAGLSPWPVPLARGCPPGPELVVIGLKMNRQTVRERLIAALAG
jgi:hypothetical protein